MATPIIREQQHSDVTTLRMFLQSYCESGQPSLHPRNCACPHLEPEDCEPMDVAAVKCGRVWGWTEDRALEASQSILMARMQSEGVL